jgi:sugar transferase (PEP-CTERM/EpsH1 system associated)
MARPVIAHVVQSLATGGLENGVVNLVNATRDSFEHVIVCLTTSGALESRLRPGVRVVTLNKRAGREVVSLAKLARALRQLRPDIVHSRNWPTIDTVIAARLARVPIVVHGEHGREAADPDGRNARRNGVRRLLHPFLNRFVCVSHDLRRWLIEQVRIPASKVITIHNGVDVMRFTGAGRDATRAELGFGPSDVVVGTVGRLDPVKGQAHLVHAFAGVARRHPESRLVITGDGPLRAELECLVDALGLRDRTRMLGERGDVPAILAALDVFVLPSVAEGISNTLLEAMATGLPVVATRVGGNPELIQTETTGLLVPARQPAPLAAAIARYVDDSHLRQLDGKNARQRAVERFSLVRMADNYTAFYAGLLRRVARRG